jgi:Domain of unknown function (DUF4114)/PEP-CTERM motif
MLHKPKNYSRLALVSIVVLGLIAALHGSPAQAYPVLGQDIYYHGGPLQFEIMPYEAAYTSQIYLYTSTGTIFLGNSSSIGAMLNLGEPAAAGLNPEDEFVLGIHVIDTGNDFFMGGGYDNPDGIVHAEVNYGLNQSAVIGFEDLFGGGDFDYNDVMIGVFGNLGVTRIPEPSSMILFGTGLYVLVFIRRRYVKSCGIKKLSNGNPFVTVDRHAQANSTRSTDNHD